MLRIKKIGMPDYLQINDELLKFRLNLSRCANGDAAPLIDM